MSNTKKDVNKLLNKYGHKKSELEKGYRKTVDCYTEYEDWILDKAKSIVEEHHARTCEECGGELIRGRGYSVCSTCGLESKIKEMKGKMEDPYKNNNESDYHKGLGRKPSSSSTYGAPNARQSEPAPDKKVIYKPDLVRIRILKYARDKLDEHLKDDKRTKYLFISEAILDKIGEES